MKLLGLIFFLCAVSCTICRPRQCKRTHELAFIRVDLSPKTGFFDDIRISLRKYFNRFLHNYREFRGLTDLSLCKETCFKKYKMNKDYYHHSYIDETTNCCLCKKIPVKRNHNE